MIQNGCKVFSFDPSMVGVKKHKRHANHLFEPIGIGVFTGASTDRGTHYAETHSTQKQEGERSASFEVETLGHIMQRHGHTHLTLLRMDVEGAEWDVLEQWIAKGWIAHIDQLLLEIHMYNPKNEAPSVVGSFHNRILRSIPMQLFHVARNYHSKMVLHGNFTSGLNAVHEVGFIRETSSTKGT